MSEEDQMREYEAIFSDGAEDTRLETEKPEQSETEKPEIDPLDAVEQRFAQRLEEQERRLQETLRTQFSPFNERLATSRVEALEAEKRRAADNGDVKAFERAAIALHEAKQATEPKKQEPKQEAPGVDPAAQRYIARSPWFQKDPEMTQYAIFLDQQYRNQGLSGDQVYERIDADMRKTFASKFAPQERQQRIEGGGKRQSGGMVSLDDLNAAERAEAENYADDFAVAIYSGDRNKAIQGWIKSYKGGKS